MNWKEQLVSGLTIGLYLLWGAYIGYRGASSKPPYLQPEYLMLGPAGVLALWVAVGAPGKERLKSGPKRAEVAPAYLLMSGVIALGALGLQPYRLLSGQFGFALRLCLLACCIRYAILFYRTAACAAHEFSDWGIKMFLIGMACVSMGATVFPPLNRLANEWTELRLFGLSADFLQSVTMALLGFLFWSVALYLGLKLTWGVIQHARKVLG